MHTNSRRWVNSSDKPEYNNNIQNSKSHLGSDTFTVTKRSENKKGRGYFEILPSSYSEDWSVENAGFPDWFMGDAGINE